MAKFRKKTPEEWNKFKSLLLNYSVLIVDGDDILAKGIAFGTYDPNDKLDLPALKDFKAVHVWNLLDNKTGKTLEADGSKIAYHWLDEYASDFLKGNIRILAWTPQRELNITDEVLIEQSIKEYLNDKYNMWENVWFGLWAVPVLGFFFNKLKNPFFNKNSMVCSQVSIMIYSKIKDIYEPLVKDIDISQMTPENLLDRIYRTFSYYLDTENELVP